MKGVSLVRWTLVAGSLLVGSTWAADDCPSMEPEVRELLEAMCSSAQEIDYRGVVTLQRGGDMQIVRISHMFQDGVPKGEMSSLTGRDAHVERAEHSTGCVYPAYPDIVAGSGLEGGVCSLADSYRFRLSAGTRIAGRSAVRLRVEPMDMYRFGYVFELDRDTALMLKSTTLSADQRVLEQFQFASLDVAPAVASTPASPQSPSPVASNDRATAPSWGVEWLPAGFMATSSMPGSALRKSYTDGLASFSVFLEPLGTAIKPGEGVERQGSTVAYTRGVMLQSQPVLVTVLGEIPTNTARMVADSVRLR